MADAVSKLYAEIGFKVKKEELENAKKVLTDFANKLTEINEATKTAIASTGKSEVKQAQENQKAILQIDKKKYSTQINNLKIYERKATAIWRTIRKVAAVPFRSTERIARTGQSIYKYMEPSLQNAYEFENFTFESGMKLADFQRFRRMFSLAGIRMSDKDIMSDMLAAQRNLTAVALNQGGVLDAYKLTDVREAAQRNDLNAVINGILRGLRENEMDDSMRSMLAGMFQLEHSVEWSRLARSNPEDDPLLASVMPSEDQRKAMRNLYQDIALIDLSFNTLRDNLTSGVAPGLMKFTKGIKDFLNKTSLSVKQGAFSGLFSFIESKGDELLRWLNSLTPEDYERGMKALSTNLSAFLEAVVVFEKAIIQLAGFINELFGSSSPNPNNSVPRNPKIHALKSAWGVAKGAVKGTAEGFATGGFFGAARRGFAGAFEGAGDYGTWTRAAQTPIYQSRPINTINNYVNTELNGLTDAQKKEELTNTVIGSFERSVKAMGIERTRDTNITYTQGLGKK